jgi:hypothetical protein
MKADLDSQTGDSVTMFSPAGNWVVVTSDFDDAIVAAASPRFIEVLTRRLPPRAPDWRPYVVSHHDRGKWQLLDPLPPSEQVVAWLSLQRFLFPECEQQRQELLTHLFGGDRATELLRRADAMVLSSEI